MSEERPKRCMLYSADAPKGRIFEGDDAIAAALEDGWLDSPGAVGGAKKKAPAKKKAAKKRSGGKGATDAESQ